MAKKQSLVLNLNEKSDYERLEELLNKGYELRQVLNNLVILELKETEQKIVNLGQRIT